MACGIKSSTSKKLSEFVGAENEFLVAQVLQMYTEEKSILDPKDVNPEAFKKYWEENTNDRSKVDSIIFENPQNVVIESANSDILGVDSKEVLHTLENDPNNPYKKRNILFDELGLGNNKDAIKTIVSGEDLDRFMLYKHRYQEYDPTISDEDATSMALNLLKVYHGSYGSEEKFYNTSPVIRGGKLYTKDSTGTINVKDNVTPEVFKEFLNDSSRRVELEHIKATYNISKEDVLKNVNTQDKIATFLALMAHNKPIADNGNIAQEQLNEAEAMAFAYNTLFNNESTASENVTNNDTIEEIEDGTITNTTSDSNNNDDNVDTDNNKKSNVKKIGLNMFFGKYTKEDIKRKTALGAIVDGQKTAHTFFIKAGNPEYNRKLKSIKEGDVVRFSSGEWEVDVKVTKAPTKLEIGTNTEDWSNKEAISEEYYEEHVKNAVYRGEAYQMEFELVGEHKSLKKEADTEGRNKVAKELDTLSINPIREADIKSAAKGMVSNKFIGFGANNPNLSSASTVNYFYQVEKQGKPTNSQEYTEGDVVFVSVIGKTGKESERHKAQDDTIELAKQAIEQGATVVCDNKSYLEKSDYNEGEKRMRDVFEKAGYKYKEIKLNNATLGVWSKTEDTPILDDRVSKATEMLRGNEADNSKPSNRFAPQSMTKEEFDKIHKSQEKGSLYVINSVFNPTELKNRIDNIVHYYDDQIERFRYKLIKENQEILNSNAKQRIKNKAQRALDKLQDDDEYVKYIVATKSNEILEGIKKDIDEYYELCQQGDEAIANRLRIDDSTPAGKQKIQHIKDQYSKMHEHAKTLIELALPSIEDSYDIKFQDREDDNTNDNDSPLNKDNDEVSGNEGWAFKIRMVDPHTTVRASVKNALSHITDRISVGAGKTQSVLDDILKAKYIPEAKAFAIIQQYIADNVVDVDDWVYKDEDGVYQYPALEQMVIQYPWIQELLNKVWDDDALGTAIFSDLYRTRVSQFVALNDGKVVEVSAPTLEQSLMDAVDNNYNNYAQLNDKEDENIWDVTGKIHKEHIDNVSSILKTVYRALEDDGYLSLCKVEYDEDGNIDNYIADPNKCHPITTALRSIGIDVTDQEVAGYVQRVVSKDSRSKEGGDPNAATERTEDEKNKALLKFLGEISGVFDEARRLQGNDNLLRAASSYYKRIARSLKTLHSTYNRSTFRQGDSDYPSYASPNFLDIVERKLTMLNDEDAKRFMENEWGYDDFLCEREVIDGKTIFHFREGWMQDMYEHPEIRKSYKVSYANAAKDENGEIIEYKNWSKVDTFRVAYQMYKHNQNTVKTGKGGVIKKRLARFMSPIHSDVEMASFITMPIIDGEWIVNKYGDAELVGDYKDIIIDKFVSVALQELDRIAKIGKRKEAGATEIGNYDKKGGEFLFLPFLNNVRIDEEGNAAIEGLSIKDWVSESLKAGNTYEDVIEHLKGILKNSILENMEKIIEKDVDVMMLAYPLNESNRGNEAGVREVYKEFLYNLAYAQTQIIQLTTTDLAYYKNLVDFQKRFKEVYAAGARLNTNSKYGRKNSYVLYLSDKIETSPTYDGVKKSLDKALADGKIFKSDYDRVLDALKDINATDAQAFRTIKSMRSILDMQGKWKTADDELYERLAKISDDKNKNKWTAEDLHKALGVIKPFTYGTVKTYDGVGGYMRTPVQHKDSEALLLAFLNETLGTEQSKSPVITGLNKAMMKFDIDTAIWESGVKAGCQGTVDISHDPDKLKDFIDSHPELKDIKDYSSYKEHFDKLLDKGKDKGGITQEEYNKAMEDIAITDEDKIVEIIDKAIHQNNSSNTDEMKVREDSEDNMPVNTNVLHTIPNEYYMIAQPTVNHVVDSKSIVGVQFSNLITADMDSRVQLTINGITYKANGKDGKNEIIDLYDRCVVSNAVQEFEGILELVDDPQKFSEALKEMARTSSSYDNDILDALEIEKGPDGTYRFVNPLYSPTNSAKIQQLALSLAKSRIVKQKMKGAACVLVSNFGYDNDLKVLRGENGEIQGFECMMPAHTEKFFTPYLTDEVDKQGNVIGQKIDIERIQKECPELLEGIGYRIPTEHKYSMNNLIIKGFLPQQMGSAIVMPAELTQLAGSDFDKHQC